MARYNNGAVGPARKKHPTGRRQRRNEAPAAGPGGQKGTGNRGKDGGDHSGDYRSNPTESSTRPGRWTPRAGNGMSDCSSSLSSRAEPLELLELLSCWSC